MGGGHGAAGIFSSTENVSCSSDHVNCKILYLKCPSTILFQLVLGCFALYATPIILLSAPGPSAIAENMKNRLKHRWEYEAARGSYRHDVRTRGVAAATRPAILDHPVYRVAAPAAPAKAVG
jgi:hypothetical protein